MKDYRSLVPREPPDGLKERVIMDLDAGGLLYQAEWVEEEPMAPILERRKPRKVKMVRVWCSECGMECLLPWADAKNGESYGFHHPGEVWNDQWGEQYGEVATSGDAVLCPMCGSPVMVIQAAKLGRKGWKVTSETTAITASVLQDGALALTGWRAQLRVYRDGHEEVAIDPMEAYVFDGREACKLNGWCNGYSGTAGYFVKVNQEWRQQKNWSESWGAVSDIYGLSEKLLERSTVPHCKLDEYMKLNVLMETYPVAYMRLWQKHPNAESLLLHGLPLALGEMIREEVRYRWEKNRRGEVQLTQIRWEAQTPAKMLGLNREELRMGRDMRWGREIWGTYRAAKSVGEILSEEDIRNIFYLGEDVSGLVGIGPVGKSVAYLLRQIELYGENEGIDPYVVREDYLCVDALVDYWGMCEQMGLDLEDKHVRFPRDLLEAHDRLTEEYRMEKARREQMELAPQFAERLKKLKRYAFQSGKLLIRPAESQEELNDEAKQLSHCVWSYAKKHATGETAIFFIRHVDKPEKSYFTLELDEKKLKVRQNRGKANCARTKEVEEFEALWLSWLRAGCKRNKDGDPVLPDKKERCA